MSGNSYFLLILGIVFIFIGIWLWRKDRQQFKILEDRLVQKEKYIQELYESLEKLMEDMDRLYRGSLSNELTAEEFEDHKEQEYDKENGYKIEDDKYKKENKKNRGKDAETKEDTEEDDIENIIIKLKKEGVPEENIAKQLGMGIGEVKLILELKNDRSK